MGPSEPHTTGLVKPDSMVVCKCSPTKMKYSRSLPRSCRQNLTGIQSWSASEFERKTSECTECGAGSSNGSYFTDGCTSALL